MAIGTFMGIAFLGQGLSMITGGAISYFLNWRGVFAVYAVLSIIPMGLLIKHYGQLPDTRNPDSKFISTYVKLLSNTKSLNTYILIFLEGMFIIGSFSYLGAYISITYQFNYLIIGAIMTAFGFMSLAGGRLGGKLVPKIGTRKLLTLGLIIAMSAEILLSFTGQYLGWLIAGIGMLGIGFMFAHSILLTRATEFAQKSRGAAIVFIDVWENREPAGRFKIRAIPTQIFFDEQGKEVSRHEGFLDEGAIIEQLTQMGVDKPVSLSQSPNQGS